MTNIYNSDWYNPSSIYKQGKTAHDKIEEFKLKIATHINAKPSQIFFVSGATEGNNIILRGIVQKNETIIISKMEHPSVRQTALDISPDRVLYVNNDPKTGLIDIQHLETLLNQNKDTKLVSIIGLSNITGTIQDLKSIGELCKQKGVWFHCDTTQWIGKFKFKLDEIPVDSCCASAHKFHGCKGAGFIYIRDPKSQLIKNTITGGSQQLFKAGTEAIGQIACVSHSMTKSLQIYSEKYDDIIQIRNYIINGLTRQLQTTQRVKLIGFKTGSNAPHIINLLFPVDTFKMVQYLGQKGICLSVGSACSKGKPSTALEQAFEIKPEDQKGSLRISLSYQNTMQEAQILVKQIKNYVQNKNTVEQKNQVKQ